MPVRRPVKSVIKQIVELLKEYIDSGDKAEATRCLNELRVPHFSHEAVFEATILALEHAGNQRASDLIVELLAYWFTSDVVHSDQFAIGLHRIHDSLDEIKLDYPK